MTTNVSLNDFKLLNIKNLKYFGLLTQELEPKKEITNEKLKERFGFYLYMLENICELPDVLDIVECITDTEFNSIMFNKKINDNGVDAVYIDNDTKCINLFNFKYRESFKKKGQELNDAVIATKFINALINENASHLDGSLQQKANQIIENFQSNEIWSLKLYLISNDPYELKKADTSLSQLEEHYDLEVIPIALPYIKKMMSIRPNPIGAEIILNEDAVMSYAENAISSSKSYLIRLPITELIRITSKDIQTRNKFDIHNFSELSNVDLDYSVLFDNVRGFIQKSKYNKNIERSLKEEPEKFFMYNNGITITAGSIKADTVNAGKKVRISLTDFQIVNGGQTLRSIHKFNKLDPDNIIAYLSKGEILVRVFTTGEDSSLINKIAEYTNSQNSISAQDLKSLAAEQIHIEQYLDEHGIIYARKAGDTGLSETKNYDHKISMERVGQILFALQGNPQKASNQKRYIFEKNYLELFGEGNLDLTSLPSNIREYFAVKKAYENNIKGYIGSDQKVFYILYMLDFSQSSIEVCIDLLEALLNKYLADVDEEKKVSQARKLIQNDFKVLVDNNLGELVESIGSDTFLRTLVNK